MAFLSWATNLVVGDTDGKGDVFVHDWQTGTTERVTGNYDTRQVTYTYSSPSISADGRYVAYTRLQTGFFATDRQQHVYVWDRRTRSTSPVSVASDGNQGNGYSDGPAISADGF